MQKDANNKMANRKTMEATREAALEPTFMPIPTNIAEKTEAIKKQENIKIETAVKEFEAPYLQLTDEEYEEIVDYAIELGIENGFVQEGETAEESFIPAFDGEGV